MNAPFPRGEPVPAALRQNFTGGVYLQMLVPGGAPLNCPVGNVTFAPGCYNRWHSHPGGQVLLCTAGRGWYQEWGRPARELHAGDTVAIAPGVKHWHGAAKDSEFSHLAIETNPAAGAPVWMDFLSAEEYAKLP